MPDDDHLVFTAWFWRKALENVVANPQIALVVAESALAVGYQLTGVVKRVSPSTLLNGYAPEAEPPGMPRWNPSWWFASRGA